MDPFATLNAVANIIDFVVYTRNIYDQVREIRTSAANITKKEEEIVRSASEVDGMVGGVMASIKTMEEASDGHLSASEIMIRSIGQQCQTLAAEVKEIIEGKALKGRSNVLSAAKSIIMGTWHLSELDLKVKELDSLERSLGKQLLAHVSNQQSGISMSLMTLMEQNRKLEIARSEDIEQLREDILAAIPAIEASQAGPQGQGKRKRRPALEKVRNDVAGWTQRAAALAKEQAIILSLRFDDMLHRRDDIPQAHNNTFRWIHDRSIHFKQWLEADDGIYWVSGDPGSGKSTLIKYLSTDAKTHEALKRWAGDKELVKASFYFWFSGTPLQKSQEGLLRSLLFEIFRQCPSAIHDACPQRWNEDPDHLWSRHELMETLKLLKLKSPTTRFCFFIDGLDEYNGDSDTTLEGGVAAHVSQIIELMNTLANLDDVKICLSSRPWHAFEQAFGASASRKLYVNEENRGDIQSYIRDKFEMADVFINARADSDGLRALVDDIVEESRGVFLWVVLVVESLLRGLTNQDRLTELRGRLEKTPKTLNAVFERMLASVEDIYHEQAAQILLVAHRAVSPLPAVLYSYIGDESHDAFNLPIKPWTADECDKISRDAQVRIKVRCPDLIKVRHIDTRPSTAQELRDPVDFLHRTVRDFLSLEDTQKQLKRRLTKPFDPCLYLSHSLLTQMKGASPAPHNGGDSIYYESIRGLLIHMLVLAKELENLTGEAQIHLLDETHRVLAHQYGRDDFIMGADSFMSLAVTNCLHLYVAANLPDALKTSRVSLLRRSLLFKHRGAATQRLFGDNGTSNMVSLLLEHGANPNELIDANQTVWGQFMNDVYQAHEMRDDPFRAKLKEKFITIIQEMIKHGADPNITCVVARGDAKPTVGRAKGIRYAQTKSLSEILAAVFSPTERRYIEALIEERRPRGFFNTVSQALGWG